MSTERIVIVGGPRCGKSWLARDMATASGCARFCGDPRSLVKEPFGGVTYLPEGLAMENESTRWIVEHWFTMPGPWICEGWIMARALRKWMSMMQDIEESRPGLVMQEFPCDRIIVLSEQRPELELLLGQVSMHKGVMKVWQEISYYFEGMTETRRWSDE
jgi:hypothetical protein